MIRFILFTATAFVLLTAFLGFPEIDAAEVVPILMADNASCADLNPSAFEFNIEYASGYRGTYRFADGMNNITLTSNQNVYLDWVATIALDAIIVKGDNAANAYIYTLEATTDGKGLQAPVNSTGLPATISHITVCYHYELTVSQTAVPVFTRTWQWDIAKSVTPYAWWLFAGEDGVSDYIVSVTKDGYEDSNWQISGLITVFNPAPFSATITGVKDVLSDGLMPTVVCPVEFPYDLPANDTLVCSYSMTLPNGNSRDNTTTALTAGLVGDVSGTASVTFNNPTQVINDAVHVSDSNGMSWGPTSISTSWTYPQTFACDSNTAVYNNGKYNYTHSNTATIIETNQSNTALVAVNCYLPAVSKNAHTTFNRTWQWQIDKVGDQTDSLLAPGETLAMHQLIDGVS